MCGFVQVSCSQLSLLFFSLLHLSKWQFYLFHLLRTNVWSHAWLLFSSHLYLWCIIIFCLSSINKFLQPESVTPHHFFSNFCGSSHQVLLCSYHTWVYLLFPAFAPSVHTTASILPLNEVSLYHFSAYHPLWTPRQLKVESCVTSWTESVAAYLASSFFCFLIFKRIEPK